MKPLEILKMLVEQDSSTKAGANLLLKKIAPLLRAYSLKKKSSNGYNSLYASVKNNLRPKILFLGHLDTVNANGWKDYNPFRFTVKNKNAYGLGVYDMKAGVAAMLHLATNFPNKDIAYLFVTDEELGGFDCAGKFASRVNPELGIALEPTMLAIETCAKGIFNLKIVSKGVSAHSSTPEKGINAIDQMNEYLSEMRRSVFLKSRDKILGRSTLCQTIIKCPNERFNQVPDYCESVVNIRYIPEQKKDQIVLLFIEKAKKFRTKYSQITVEELSPLGCSVKTDKNNEYVKILANSIKSEIGKVGYIGSPGASDARFFAERKIPVTCFGPVGGGMHAPNEWIDLRSFEKYVKILENFVNSI